MWCLCCWQPLHPSQPLCTEPGWRCREALPLPFLSLCRAFFGLLGFLSPLSHAGSNRRGIGLVRGLPRLPAPLRVNLQKHGALWQRVGRWHCAWPNQPQTDPVSSPRGAWEEGARLRAMCQRGHLAGASSGPLWGHLEAQGEPGFSFPCRCWIYSGISSHPSSEHRCCSGGSSMGRGRIHLSSAGILHLLVPNPQHFMAGQPKTLLKDPMPHS